MTDPTSLPSFPPSPDEHPLRGRVLDALIDESLQPSIDEDGDVAIEMQEQMLFVRCLDTEPPMMRVFGQWLLDDSLAGDELTRLRAANAVTGALNLVKVTVHADRLAVAVDLVVGDGVDLRPLLSATLEAVLGSVRTWHQTVTQLLEVEDPQAKGKLE
jgi:type III secretion system-like peptide-binding chaperone